MLATNFFSALIFLFLLSLVFGYAEFSYRRGMPPYMTRKIVHIGGGIGAALLPIFVDLKTFIILGAGFFFLLVLSKRRGSLNSIHKTNGHSVGALLFAPSLMLTAIIFWPLNTIIFQASVLVLGLSDGVAGIMGGKYGKKKYSITGTKTIEGSLIFFLITTAILSGFLYVSGTPLVLGKALFIFVGSLLLTMIEAASGRGWDNLFIPIATGAILYFAL